MGLPDVAAFTDTFLPTVNGVTYTVDTWRDRWLARDGRMDVVYPASDHDPAPGEHPVWSVPFPFYEGFRVALPRIPSSLPEVDVVHTHTPFSLGVAADRFARQIDAPLVASFHTPVEEYAAYLPGPSSVERVVERAASRYERWFLDRTDLVLAPSETTATHLRSALDVRTRVAVLRNGVDVEHFRPVETAAFRERHDIPDGPVVGYTGRHGYEKRLEDVVRAVEGLPVTLVFAGDGPAREGLERRARAADVDARFLGFLDRAELPALYSTLDVFAFPSPVETQGLVALEANACGTPVVGAAAGALCETIEDGENGFTVPVGDVDAFRTAVERALEERTTLREQCLARREETSVEHSLDNLVRVYETL